MKASVISKRRVKMIVAAVLAAVTVLCMGFALYAADTASGVLSSVATESPTLSEDGKTIIIPTVPEGYTIAINGSSNESVIDTDGNVYTPLVDTTVKVNYKVTKAEDGTTAVDQYKEASIVISGRFKAEDGDNAEPAVLPKLREWKGGNGTVSVTEASRIVVTHAAFLPQAELINEYIADIMGEALPIVTESAMAGDIVIGYTDAKELGDEGYTVELSDRVTVLAYNGVGALYGGTTVAQLLTLYEGYALPKGMIRDYPAYEVRSSMMDVARHYVPLDYLTEMSKYLAYFKVNQIHVHINDNGGQQGSAFRVESKKYPAINAAYLNGNIYSQEDYRAYQKEMLRYGVKVITEIDSPGHAGFAGLYDKSLVIANATGYLDLVNNYDGNIEFMQGLLDEFIVGDEENPPVILNEIDTIHLGMDEYSHDHARYKDYMSDICAYAKSLGKTVQIWSSLKTADFSEELPVSPEDVLVNYWGDADLKAYASEGFFGISNYPSKLYVVPGGANAFGDRVDIVSVYDSYEANVVSGSMTLSESSPLLLGVEGAIWNDFNRATSKEGYFDRVRDQMLLVSEKAWHGKAEGVTGEQFEARVRSLQNLVPMVDPASFVPANGDGVIAEYDFANVENGTVKDTANGLDATLNGLSVSRVGGKSVLTLDGKGYMALPVKQIGFPYTVNFGLTYSSTTSGVLFAGGDSTFWLNADGDGKITFTRELHSYAFNFVFKKNVSYDVTLLCNGERLSLYVDGVYVEDAHVTAAATERKNLASGYFSDAVLSTARVGEGIIGTLDGLTILGTADGESLSGLENMKYKNLALGKVTSASGTEVNYKWGPENAVDGITQGSDFKVSLNRVDNAWLTIDLGAVYYVDTVKIYFVQSPVAYKVLISNDGVNYTEVYDQPAANAAKASTDVIGLGEGVSARFIKYQQVEMFSATLSSGAVARYSGSFAEIEVYGSEMAITENLALGKEVVECSPNEKGTTGVPSDLTDGNNVASWENRVCFDGGYSAYFIVDLAGDYPINDVNIYWYQVPNKYQVYVSDNKSDWTLVYEGISANGGKLSTDVIRVGGSVSARYVKVIQTEKFADGKGRLYWGNLSEIEVIGITGDVELLDSVNEYLATLSGDAYTHLYNRIKLVKKIITGGNTELSALAIKFLREECDRMQASDYTVDTEYTDLYRAVLDVKFRKHASSDAAYGEYQAAYKLALSAYMNSGTDSATRTDRLSLVNKAILKLAKPDGVTSTFQFGNISALTDGNTGSYIATTETTQAVGETITITYNKPITFASLRLVAHGNYPLANSIVEISTDGTTFRAIREADSAGKMRNMLFGLRLSSLSEMIMKNPIDGVVAIRITVTAAHNKQLRISEILVNENVDLDVLIPEASSYSLEDYTTGSIFPFAAYYKSEAVTRGYISNFSTYVLSLIPRGSTAAISAKIAELNALDKTSYTDASVAALNVAIAAAQSFVNSFNDNVSVYKSDAAYNALVAAEKALVKKTALDTAELEGAIASARINTWEYTYYSHKALERAVNYAVSLLNNDSATQDMIDEACARVKAAVAALEARGAKTNVALNKTLIISGREVSNQLGPELAVDGDLSTRFSPNIKDGAFFIVDLGEAMMLDSVEVNWKSNPRKYRVLVSTENENYVTVYEALDSTVYGKAVTDVINFAGAIEARYVKFDLTVRFPGQYDRHLYYSGSPNEVMIYSADMTVSKGELQYFVELYEGIVIDSFAPQCRVE
ncbi:MAG: discoidin domain-containing protein, partial [Clostridia bacterium]|nr:discoidin domain-containing protein [Clostridia bacterium]